MCFVVQWAIAQTNGSIQGKVTDVSGAAILGAVVTVEGADGSSQTTVTDNDGIFQISSLKLSNYDIKISASGLSDWTATNVLASVTPESSSLLAVLQVASKVTTVTVGLSPEEVAAEQFKRELNQRVLGIVPNYYVTYENHPAPLRPKQKLRLGLKTLLDPTTFAGVGITAGIQQGMNSYYQYGQGAEGFAKRFGAAYATAASNLLITSGLAGSVLHQDPRYFCRGRGTTAQRAWYAVESSFLAKGDNGTWQPPYSDIIGSIASAEISQAYYPGSRTQYTLLGRSTLFHFAGQIGVNLAQEFLLKKLTSNKPPTELAANTPVLREGTPVALIALDRLDAERVPTGRTISFVLAQDLTVDGKVLARAGDTASGQVGRMSGEESAGETSSTEFGRVMLRAGKVSVPLRSSHVRGTTSAMQWKALSDSGKVEVTLFVAQNVQFPED
jgi:hypothetical protein